MFRKRAVRPGQPQGKHEVAMLNIKCLLTKLAQCRKVFHSEADFQHALAWQIHQTKPGSQVRLEYPVPGEHQKMYVDIYLPDEKIAIELKYATRGSELVDNGESFALRNQGAQNLKRYDFLRDIERLERMRSKPEFCETGHAVLLTNDWLYWDCPEQDTKDAAFRIHEGREISSGKLAWAKGASPGMVKGREDSIKLEGPYCFRWQDYSCITEKSQGKGKPRGKFRYLAVSVG